MKPELKPCSFCGGQAGPLLHAQIMYLRKYQAWRTGEDERTMDEAGIVPRAITSSLNDVLDFAEKQLLECCSAKAMKS